MTATCFVPAAVPSLTHNCRPAVPSLAVKYSLPLKATRSDGCEPRSAPVPAGLMSFTCFVPAAVPSLTHSSSPAVPSPAAKNSRPPTEVSCRIGPQVGTSGVPRIGASAADFGLTCRTRTVPPAVPSVFHSS